MFRLIAFAVLLYLLYRLVKGFLTQGKEYREKEHHGVVDEMVQDPVCKTYIPRREAVKRTFRGKDILFCSKECADKFKFEKKDR
jgi:YHS domain-containing protein